VRGGAAHALLSGLAGRVAPAAGTGADRRRADRARADLRGSGTPPVDLGNLEHVLVDEVGRVLVQESPSASFRPCDRFGESSASLSS